jgi:serine/threonine protein kinase
VRSPRETFGPYVVHEALGTGGMATVHRAEFTGIEGFSRAVALKRMQPSLTANEDAVAAFVREARLASYLHHANVGQIYELGEHDGTYFIAMELIPGRSLHDILARCAELAAPMPIGVALAILNQILDALDYAHNLTDHSGQPLGIIHRDVSPGNIILAEGGVAKLIDFGIAKASAAGMQTQSVTLKGKWAYIAPEYVNLGQIDARADLFAVGVIAHELLSNQPLFSAADDLETLARLRDMAIPMPSQVNAAVPVAIDHVVMTALARDPSERWQTASAMRNALGVVTKRVGLEVTPLQVQQWIDGIFGDLSTAAAPPPAPAKPLAAILNETGQVAAIRGNKSRLETGAEPLWDLDAKTPPPAPIALRARVMTPATPAVVVSVHPKKQAERKEKARRGAIIAASVIVTLGLAAAGYLLLG